MKERFEYVNPNWDAPKNVRCLTTTRIGGLSQGTYEGLNLGYHVEDNPTHVLMNRMAMSQHLSLPNPPFWLNQKHSDQIAIIDEKTDQNVIPIADGSITTLPNIVCAVMTADCLPMMLCDRAGTCVGVVHCGWRGLLNNIVSKAVEQLKKQCQGPILAWLGPAIGPLVYEVGDEIKIAFELASPTTLPCFSPVAGMPNKWLLNLYKLAEQQLKGQGVHDIFGGEFCTYTQSDLFFSHRRERPTGRMASLIWLSA